MSKSKLFKVLILALIFSTFASSVFAVDIYYLNRIVPTDADPLVKNGRTLVPISTIAKSMGAEVSWNGNTHTVNIKKGSIEMTLTIGSTTVAVTKNGVKSNVSLDVAAQTIQDRTMVPIGAISGIFEKNVAWHESEFGEEYVLIDCSSLEGDTWSEKNVFVSKDVNKDGLSDSEFNTIKKFLMDTLVSSDAPLEYDKLDPKNYGEAVRFAMSQFAEGEFVGDSDTWKMETDISTVTRWLKDNLYIDMVLKDGDVLKPEFYEDSVIKVQGNRVVLTETFMSTDGLCLPAILAINKTSPDIFHIKFNALGSHATLYDLEDFAENSAILKKNSNGKFSLLYFGPRLDDTTAKKYS